MPEKLYLLADKILNSTFYILLFTVPFIFSPWNFELFEFNKMILTYALTVIIVSAWAIKSILSGRLILRRTFLDFPLLLFLISQILSTIGSVDIHTSIWGYYTRSNGGLLSTITYLLLYWAFVSNMDKHKTQYAIRYLFSSALIVSLWGILEHFGRSPSCLLITGNFDASCWIQDVQNRVFATLGQPNWMAAFLVAVMPLSWALVLSNKQSLPLRGKSGKLILNNYYLLGIIFFLALLFTKSRSGILSFAVSSMVFWGLLVWINRKHLSTFIRPALILNTLYLILIFLFGTPWSPSVIDILNPAPGTRHPASETGTILERGGTESGEIRKIVWKGAIDIWRAYPLFGSGVETFAYSYYNFRLVEHNLTSEWNFLYNKAHNEYLNFLATTGVFGLGTYLLLIGAFLVSTFLKIKITNQKHKNFDIFNCHFDIYILNFALLAGFASILVTNFFGFSVVPVALLFFLYLAMAVASSNKQVCCWRNKEEVVSEACHSVVTNKSKKLILNSYYLILIPIVLLFTFYVLLRLGQLWYADTLFNQADKLVKSDEPAQAAEKLEKAIILNDGEPNYHDRLATAYSEIAVVLAEEDKTQDAKKFADLAKQETDKAYAISPRNISLLKSRASTFNRIASVDETYLTYTLITLERAAILAPTDPTINYNLAITYYRAGQSKEAIGTLEKLNRMKSDYADSHFALAEIYIAEGQKDKARQELEYILKNIDPKNELAKKSLEKL